MVKYSQFIEYFMPSNIQKNPYEELKAKMLIITSLVVGSILILGALIAGFAFGGFFLQKIFPLIIIILLGTLSLSCILLLKMGISATVSSLPLIVASLSVPMIAGLTNGGVLAPAVSFLIIIPIIGQFFGNILIKQISFAITIASFVLLYVLAYYNLTSPFYLNYDLQLKMITLVGICCTTIAYLISGAHEKHRQEVESRLTRISQVTSIELMSGGISHELNSPITAILMNAEVLLKNIHEKSIDSNLLQVKVERIIKSAQKLSNITSVLQDTQNLKEPNLSNKVSLTEVFNLVKQLCEDRLKAMGIELQLPDNAKNLHVKGHREQLAHALVLHLNNSIDAVSTLSSRWIKIQVRELDNNIEIKIIDSGPGISDEVQRRLFIPFFTTKDVGQGFGLGLIKSASILMSLGGTVRYEPNSKNTTFLIQLPKMV